MTITTSSPAEDALSSSRAPESPRTAPGLIVKDIDSEILILDTVADRIHQLNRSASLIWRLYTSGLPEQEVAGVVATTYELSQDIAERDTRTALRHLRDLRLIT